MRWQKKIPAIFISLVVLLPFVLSRWMESKAGELTEEGDYQLSASCKPNPKLVQFEERLTEIKHQINTIIDDYKKGMITKIAAEDKVRVLLAEEISIQRDHKYTIEQRIEDLFCISQ